MQLVIPALKYLPSYKAALETGWSADNMRGKVAADEELEYIARDPEGFVASLYDPEAKGDPITLKDGSKVARLPGYRKWMWDGEFCGSIGLRWPKDKSALPPHVPGHIGYGVVPWKQGKGYATRALSLILNDAAELTLPYVELTTNPDNLASQKVIAANGGIVVAKRHAVAAQGGRDELLFRIPL